MAEARVLTSAADGAIPSAAPIIELRGVEKRYGAGRAVNGIDLRVRKGEFLALLGPSGCGKTTTLRMIAGFESPSRGEILLHGRDMSQDPPNKRPVNTVFQDYALFPHMTVAQNVGFGLSVAKRPKAEINARVVQLLAMVGLDDKAGRMPANLSGGQRQRVALARALACEPEVLLLDEPLSALDAHLRHQMQIELKQIQARLGLTFIIVTHDQAEALVLADRIVVMNHGVIAQIGAPAALYDYPASPFVARFLGAANLLAARLTGIAGTAEVAGTTLILSPDIATPSGPGALLCVRPERLTLTDIAQPGLTLPAIVENRHFMGIIERVQLRLADGQVVIADLPHRGPPPPPVGAHLHITLEQETIRLFAPEEL